MKIISYLLIPLLAFALIAAVAAVYYAHRECTASGGVLIRGVLGNKCVILNAPTTPAPCASGTAVPLPSAPAKRIIG